MKRALAVVTAFVSIWICGPAAACDCATQTPREALARADAVFEGVVLESGPSRWAGAPCGGVCPDTAVRLRVLRRWKGALAREVVVYTEMGSDCGVALAVGRTYLVYASAAPDRSSYLTDACTRTAPIESASRDLHELGPGSAPRRERAPRGSR